MTPTEYFRLLAPEFASVSDGAVATWLTVAGNMVDTGCLETEVANMALALYAAHLLWVTQNQASGSGGGMGSVKLEKEGDLTRAYHTMSGDNTWLGQSPYGQWYLNVTAPCFGAGIMTRIGPYGT